jgi:SAM-dependent methyltransferase
MAVFGSDGRMPGILYEDDWECLIWSVRLVLHRFRERTARLNFCEVGCAEGGTSAGVLALLDAESEGDYRLFGIDCEALMGPPRIAHERFEYLRGFSFAPETLARVPPLLHWVFIDACHCAECVTRDAGNFAPRLPQGGLLVFHDASPATQGRDPQGYAAMREHHDHETAVTGGIQVRAALDRLNLGELGLELLLPVMHQGLGGVEVYERTRPA